LLVWHNNCNQYLVQEKTIKGVANLQGLQEALKDLGLPERDIYSLPSSNQRFSDGGHFRVEIAGVEKFKVPIHRIIATVGGATYLAQEELKEFAKIANEAKIEVIMTLGPRRAWDSGRQISTSEGLVSGMRLRGMDNVGYWLKDLERCIDAGFRGFLVADEGLMWLVNNLRDKGVIPKDVIFKVSVFAGHANPAGAKVIESLGANSFNPLADLTLPMLSSIRSAVKIPLDIYMCIVNAMGGFVRFYEATEIARICSPCYFKIEPGPSEEGIYAPWNSPEYHANQIKERIRNASVILELVNKQNSEIKCSPAGGEDLAIPRP